MMGDALRWLLPTGLLAADLGLGWALWTDRWPRSQRRAANSQLEPK